VGCHGFSAVVFEERLVEDEGVVAKARAGQMSLLRELDRRQVALCDGRRLLQEWAAGRMDVASERAGRLVAMAWRLQDLPDVDDAVSNGVIGVDRAAAVSRCAGRGDVLDLLGETAGFDVAGIRIRAARRRRMAPSGEEIVFERRCVAVQPNLDESSWTVAGRLPGFAGRTVVAAFEAEAGSFPHGPGANPSRTIRNADALWAISQDSFNSGDGATVDASTPVVSVVIDASEAATTTEADVPVKAGPHVGPNTPPNDPA
jgi:hypothetical protein